MSEVTRVPLQPIKQGSVLKLWLGIIVAVLIGAAIAWAAMPKGLSVDVLQAGTGASPTMDDVVFVKYKGTLDDGTVFDESQPVPLPVEGIFPEGNPMPLDGVVPGFRDGLLQTKKGGKYLIEIPAEQAYGAEPPPGAPIPANADLTFEVEVVDFMSREDFDRRLQQLQQMMQAQMPEGLPEGAQPIPGGPAPGQ